MLKRLETSAVSASGGSELARGYADLLTAAAAQGQVSALEIQLEGPSEALLVQAPTLPQKASQPKKALMAIGATLETALLLLLLFIFVRQALRNTATDANSASKLARMRRALGLKNQAAQ